MTTLYRDPSSVPCPICGTVIRRGLMTPHIRGGNSAIENCHEYSSAILMHESSYGGEIDSTLVITANGNVVVVDGEYDVTQMSSSMDDIERFMSYLNASSSQARQLIKDNDTKLTQIQEALD
ncbi:MAG: hypothetical protein KAJ19_11045 [Gammaproteobacteria bacterium]|nr:hypothetical protein [Gammaproteobacteria bacterium]